MAVRSEVRVQEAAMIVAMWGARCRSSWVRFQVVAPVLPRGRLVVQSDGKRAAMSSALSSTAAWTRSGEPAPTFDHRRRRGHRSAGQGSSVGSQAPRRFPTALGEASRAGTCVPDRPGRSSIRPSSIRVRPDASRRPRNSREWAATTSNRAVPVMGSRRTDAAHNHVARTGWTWTQAG